MYGRWPGEQQRAQQPPDAAEVIVCPSCGEQSLGAHCQSPTCNWLLCGNPACRSYGIPGERWCDMRKRPAA